MYDKVIQLTRDVSSDEQEVHDRIELTQSALSIHLQKLMQAAKIADSTFISSIIESGPSEEA